MATSVKPFLMFAGAAEEAMNAYVALFPDSQITVLERRGAGEPGKEGTVKKGEIVLAGQAIKFFDSPVKHAFTFTPAQSLFVECESEAELARMYAALADGGSVLMPLEHYGFSQRFGWVNDRFGVSWQLNWD
jgi:predicted 3-demethylubiquinone-9 3-methyltransferase (glyoxalase superfamily)